MNRAAAIDIGTNSTRLLIGELNKTGKITPLASELQITRLGAKVDQTGRLNQASIQRTIEALAKYKSLLEQYQVREVRVVATSAARDVSNQAEFINKVKERTGLKVEIITGTEEARLSYLGVIKSLSELLATDNLVLDIGGGSTEFIFGSSQRIEDKFSLNVGAVRMTEQSKVISEREKLIKKTLLPQIRKLTGKVKALFGVGGTITTLAAIERQLVTYDPQKVHGYLLKLTTIERIFSDLAAKTIEERKEVIGLQPKRADIIVAGVQILLLIMEVLELTEIIVSEADILEGIIYDCCKGEN
ncbi:Ppx/GppA phosphatase family protein [Fuchsiella alkaliacetigena]|uniref:Ppx/GppA phosphatase family protein n=1 Tax=Fuchsiella alkaliacetigena TaxID=957042 RepID=UPI00200ABBEA|nr:Ppx/GppA phosphatase family protein [Fuchsiella alkaliacetigena]MCK8824901.1 Ppx/GppA family phosphatase [Fuchsiella alkaliacetigena]